MQLGDSRRSYLRCRECLIDLRIPQTKKKRDRPGSVTLLKAEFYLARNRNHRNFNAAVSLLAIGRVVISNWHRLAHADIDQSLCVDPLRSQVLSD